MASKKVIDLPEDFALVLQEIRINGEEDINELKESMDIRGTRLRYILQSLRSKGLISFTRTIYGNVQIKLSIKGRKLTNYIWPRASQRI